METATLIALGAVVVSLIGFGVSYWATRLSKTSLDHAFEVHNYATQRDFGRDRAELLQQISEQRRRYEEIRIEIGTLKANFDAEKQPVQTLLENLGNSLFDILLPVIEKETEGLDTLWLEMSALESSDHPNWDLLLKAKSTLYHFDGSQTAYQSAKNMIAEFTEKLDLARGYVSGATR